MNDEQQDLLISRIVGGEAEPGEWDALSRLAAANPSTWSRVVEMQRDQAALERLVERAGDVAERVPAVARTGERGHGAYDDEMDHEIEPDIEHDIEVVWPRLRVTSQWAGWLVAAVLAMAWFTGRVQPPVDAPPGAAAPALASVIPVSTAQEALDAYMEKGRDEDRVIREMPRMVLLESRPNPSGEGYELIYLRQLMEKKVVPDLYHFTGQDEQGRPELTRYRPSVRGKM